VRYEDQFGRTWKRGFGFKRGFTIVTEDDGGGESELHLESRRRR